MLAHAASLAAQANHPAPTAGDGKPAYIETLNYKGFTGVHNSGNVDVIYTAGKEYSVTPQATTAKKAQKYLDEAIAFYQQAAQSNNLSE